MEPLSLSFIVGAVANFASMLIYFSPMLTFWRIVKKGSTEEFSGLPYICTLQQAALWVYYGITKPGATLVAIGSSVGVVMEFIYVTLFLIYAPPHIRVKTGVLVAILNVGFLGVAVMVTHFAMQGNLRINVIGVLCAGPNILMYGSPLSTMRIVIKKKSVEYMPFLLSFVTFLCAAAWTLYSVLTKDLFLGVPNGIGLLLGTAQLILYAIYSDPRGAKSSIQGFEEVPNGIGFVLGTAQLILYAIYSKPKGAKSRIQGFEDCRKPLIQPVEVHEKMKV